MFWTNIISRATDYRNASGLSGEMKILTGQDLDLLFEVFKWIIYPEMYILSSFTHHHVFPNPYNFGQSPNPNNEIFHEIKEGYKINKRDTGLEWHANGK